MTAQEAIKRGMRLLGVLSAGEEPTTAELTDGLEVFNSVAAFWGAQSWCVPSHIQDILTLTAGDGEYTIGSGQDIDTVLPTQIVSAFLRDSDGFDHPLEIISQAEYAAIYDKDIQAEPEKICFVKASTTGTVKLWPVPDAADTLYIESKKRLGNYALTDQLGLPAEWELPLCYNFAVHYALEFQIEVSPTLGTLAEDTLAKLKALNAQPVPRVCTDLAGLSKPSTYNVFTDEV